MSDDGPRRLGVSIEVKPHAYDPVANPELFEGVLARRCIAFVIDVIIIAIPVLLAALFIVIFGVVTLGLGWLLFWLFWPAKRSARCSRISSASGRPSSTICSPMAASAAASRSLTGRPARPAAPACR